jgi:hypothetical protein
MAAKSWNVRLFDGLLWLQGGYCLITGIWPLVSIETFQAVTGRKTDHLPTGLESDHWLVMTVGVLVTAIAVTLLTAAWRRQETFEMAVLGLATAVGLTAIDIIYVSRRVIAPIYLIDAGVEILIAIGWLILIIKRVHWFSSSDSRTGTHSI